MSDAVLQRRLRALGCGFANEASETKPIELQRTVCWLEDSVIRRRRTADRGPLRSAEFLDALTGYLAELNAPADVSAAHLATAVRWLTRVALQLAFDDDRTRYNEPVDPWEGRRVPVVRGAATDRPVAEVTQKIIQDIGSDHLPSPSTEVALRAISNLAEAKWAAHDPTSAAQEDVAMVAAETAAGSNIPKRLDLDAIPLGFSTGDPAVDRVAKVLRLLYVRELRLLQNRVNEAISSMQAVTADPKTDSKLGQVGR
jgi:RLL motif containing protein 1